MKKKKKAKKAAPRKKEIFRNATPDQSFFVCNGMALRNVLELSQELENMSEDAFYYHVNDGRNDFANWVRDVLSENDLADELAKACDKDKAQVVVLKHIIRQFS